MRRPTSKERNFLLQFYAKGCRSISALVQKLICSWLVIGDQAETLDHHFAALCAHDVPWTCQKHHVANPVFSACLTQSMSAMHGYEQQYNDKDIAIHSSTKSCRDFMSTANLSHTTAERLQQMCMLDF